MQVPEVYVPLWTGRHPDTGERLEHYAFHGGRGGGKSHGIGEAIVGLSSQGEERVVCGREFQNSIKDSVKELMEQKIKQMNMAALFTSTERELINVSTGSRISFIGMNRNPESAKSLEGCTFFWGEEAQVFSLHSVEIIIPTIRAPGSRMAWSWNPRNESDPVDRMFRGPVPPEAAYVREVSWRDNIYFYRTRMPSEFRRSLRATPKRHLHVWEGGYDINPDAIIFDNYEIGRPEHLPENIIPRFGLDFGYSNDPNAFVKAYILDDIDTIYIAQECYRKKIPTNRLPEEVMDNITESKDYWITADSARPETIEYLDSVGYPVRSARKGAGSIKNGISWLQGYKLLIDPDCPEFKREVQNYKWMADPDGRILSKPIDDFNHGIDALRYAVEDESIYGDSGDGVDFI